MSGFAAVFRQLCARYPNEQERGRAFEHLVQRVLLTAPMYRERFSEVHRWNEWLERDGVDIGIDIVARRHDGGLVAIQCKCQDRIDKHTIDSFLADSQRLPSGEPFVERYIFSTARVWSNNANRALTSIDPPVQRVDLSGFDGAAIDWDAYLEDDQAPLKVAPPKELLPHQLSAIDDVFKGFKTNNRGKLIMACGTGKTLTALRIAEHIAGLGGRVLLAAPSLSLLAQSMREWGADAKLPIRAFAVCSDTSVGRKDGDSTRTYDMPIPATTNAESLTSRCGISASDRMTVVFSTYQSMKVIADSHKVGLPDFDLVICDEAHRTTGALREGDESSFLLVHDDDEIHARKRLYMTATPRIYAEKVKTTAKEEDVFLASMDNEEQYGPEFHRLSFAKAVEGGLLSDYKVTILVMSEHQIARDYQELLADGEALADVGKVIGCLNGLAKVDPEGKEFEDDPEPMRRAVAFSNTIKYSEHFVSLVQREQQEEAPTVRNLSFEGRHVDGKSGVLERDRSLNWLREDMAEAQRCHILSNARCLTEGIDVPALDAILFLQPRKSQVDVVQAVGRVMRKAEGKLNGYIILPVVVPSGEDAAAALDRNDAYSHVWEVLQALRSHDERFDAYVNKLDLNRSNDGPISVIGVGTNGKNEESGHVSESAQARVFQGLLGFDIGGLRDAIIAQIVKRCGERRYWEKWADSVTDIARRHDERIRALIADPDGQVGVRFDEFVAALRDNLNDSITRERAAEMLSQHLITKPVFDALFGGQQFTNHNPVSRVMQRMVDELAGYGLEAETAELAGFYESVRRRVEGIDNAKGKQRVVVELYERFFKVAYPKDADSLGIVYTPVEIVDFIVRSVEELLYREFDASLRDEGVHILDPFAGTGTFITRLLQSGFIDSYALRRKYASELHANEVTLLAYYIAAVNIESAYAELTKEYNPQDRAYRPFDGIVLTDTFQTSEASDRRDTSFFPRNNARMERQLSLDIRVIIGNPPWSRAQSSQNDDNPNQQYPTLDQSIRDTYAANSAAKLKNTLYDSFVRAVRWASDRVQASDGGVVGFVTNSAFIRTKSFDGFRKVLCKEFQEIYVYDLRGNQRTSRETSRREGGKVFGSGSRAGVAVLLLVKRPAQATEPAAINYYDVGDYLSSNQKLEVIRKAELREIDWTRIEPNAFGDWLNQRSPKFLNMRPLIRQDAQNPGEEIFAISSYGVNSGRDQWVYNSSGPKLRSSIRSAIEFFNGELRRIGSTPSSLERVDRSQSSFSWDRKTEQRLIRGELLLENNLGYRPAIYRPFFRQHMYINPELNARTGVQLRIFPKKDSQTPSIVLERGLRAPGGNPAVIAVNQIPNIAAGAGASGGACQSLPRYTYEESAGDLQSSMLSTKAGQRDNITDKAFHAYSTRYGKWVNKDHIFAYVYGILHSPEYRQRYAADLTNLLPRIPDVATTESFRAFSEAGQRLLELHIGYEEAEPYPLEEHLSPNAPEGPERYRVSKMRWGGSGKSPDKSVIIFNDWITLTGIPDEAHEYIVGPRSALEWLLDRYKVTKDSASGIVNDPNDWGLEMGYPRYIIDLVKRVTTVSVETMKIVKSLPPLDEAD